MKRRKDYSKFKEILDKYQIKRFYHFTDRSNIESIVKNGGLYSWGDCIRKGIHVVHPGGDDLSHDLDSQESLQYYSRISICKRHPMMFYAMKEGRIPNPVILEIDTDILYQDGNIFSDMNAVKGYANKGTSFSDFGKIHFTTALKSSQFDVDEDEREFFQAEILVKNHIPLNYITNITDFIERDPSNGNAIRVRDTYSAQITEINPAALIFILNQSYPTNVKILYKGEENTISQVVCDMINRLLYALITQNTNKNIVHNRYQVSVIGYGDYAYNCLEGPLASKTFVDLSELDNNPLLIKKTIKEKKTRQGVVKIENDEPIWIKPKSDGNAYLHKALHRARNLAEKWIDLHPSSFPPIIVHISCYGYNGVEHSDIIQLANEIKSLYTKDGNVLLANIIISLKSGFKPILFPTSIWDMGNSVFGEKYYLMSSQLPLCFNQQVYGFRDRNNREMFHTAIAFNTGINDLPALLQAFIIGR